MADKREVYIIQALDFEGDIDEFVECPGNDCLEWYHINDGMDEDDFQTWVKSQVPENVRSVLLEWMW